MLHSSRSTRSQLVVTHQTEVHLALATEPLFSPCNNKVLSPHTNDEPLRLGFRST